MVRIKTKTPKVFAPLFQPARYKGAHGGRGSAKSWTFADMMIDRCLDGGVNAVCTREIQKSLDQSVKKLLENTITGLGVGSLFGIMENKIITPGGGNIIFQGLQNHTVESIKSLEGYDINWTEEAQTISQRSLELLRPTIRNPYSELWFSWNPAEESDPIDVFLRGKNRPENAIVVEANYWDNPFFPDVLREEMIHDKQRDYGKYLHVWEGKYQKMHEALVFKHWKVENFKTHDEAMFRFGADWGFANDPTVLVRSYIIGKKLYIDYEACKVGCAIDFTPDLFATVPESNRWPIVADSARPETIDYMQAHGYPDITPALKGKGSIVEGVEYLKSYDIVVHPRCVRTIHELKRYAYKTDPLTNKIIPIFEDKNNHVIDALRYSCEGARRTQPWFPPQDMVVHANVYA